MCPYNNKYNVSFCGEMTIRGAGGYVPYNGCSNMYNRCNSNYDRCGIDYRNSCRCRCCCNCGMRDNDAVPYGYMLERYCITGNGYGVVNSMGRQPKNWCSDCLQ